MKLSSVRLLTGTASRSKRWSSSPLAMMRALLSTARKPRRGARYLVKARRLPLDEPALALSRCLYEQGIQEVVAPLPALDGLTVAASCRASLAVAAGCRAWLAAGCRAWLAARFWVDPVSLYRWRQWDGYWPDPGTVGCVWRGVEKNPYCPAARGSHPPPGARDLSPTLERHGATGTGAA